MLKLYLGSTRTEHYQDRLLVCITLFYRDHLGFGSLYIGTQHDYAPLQHSQTTEKNVIDLHFKNKNCVFKV